MEGGFEEDSPEEALGRRAPRPHRAEEAGVLRLEGVNASASVHRRRVYDQVDPKIWKADGAMEGLDFSGRAEEGPVRRGVPVLFGSVVPGVCNSSLVSSSFQDGERGWVFKLHSVGLWISGDVVSSAEFWEIIRVPFSGTVSSSFRRQNESLLIGRMPH